MPLFDRFFGYFDSPGANKVTKIVFKYCPFISHSNEIESFVKFDLPLWNNLTYEKDCGLNPTLVFEDKEGKTIFDLDVTEMSRREITDVLKTAGLRKIRYMFDGKPTIVPRDNEADLF
ncbi:hypothetical protein M8J76_006193 [Diaphorina citri]|nr:hypothetical protein M8J76_006193 [Diaphorina citri]KAI5746594.1 hypothetical protein M8J77_005247 [Diaphorina citri]